MCPGAGVSKIRDDGGNIPAEWFVEQVEGMGFPLAWAFAVLAVAAEVACGALLALGLLTRFAGLVTAVHFAVAAFLFHQVWPIRDINIAQLYVWSSLVFVFLGSGRVSLDGLIRRD